MTKTKEQYYLKSPNTRKLVHDALGITKGIDCMEAYYDMIKVVEILKNRMDRTLGHSVIKRYI